VPIASAEGAPIVSVPNRRWALSSSLNVGTHQPSLCSERTSVPVIWATQVLDGLGKTGTPSRAEITDAAMGQRAECVMLDKGPHIEDTIAILSHILARTVDHNRKKESRLRRLTAWERPSG